MRPDLAWWGGASPKKRLSYSAMISIPFGRTCLLLLLYKHPLKGHLGLLAAFGSSVLPRTGGTPDFPALPLPTSHSPPHSRPHNFLTSILQDLKLSLF